MSQANRYLEEQFPKYYIEPQKPAQLPEPVTIPIGARDDKEHDDSNGTGTASKQPIWKNRRNWLIAMVALAVIVVGAAVGSGVGVSLASKNDSDASAALATSIGQDNTQSATITSASISAPTSTLDSETEPTTISETSSEETRSVAQLVMPQVSKTNSFIRTPTRQPTTVSKATKTTKTTKETPSPTEVCAEGTVADGETKNYLGLCKFSCGYGYCPPGPCTCVAYGKPKEEPDVINVRGCPLPDLSDGYLGLCSFACNHGYCPETACTTKCDNRKKL